MTAREGYPAPTNVLDAIAALAGCACDVCKPRKRLALRAGDHRCSVCVGIDFSGTGLACPWCGRGAVQR